MHKQAGSTSGSPGESSEWTAGNIFLDSGALKPEFAALVKGKKGFTRVEGEEMRPHSKTSPPGLFFIIHEFSYEPEVSGGRIIQETSERSSWEVSWGHVGTRFYDGEGKSVLHQKELPPTMSAKPQEKK